MQAAKVSTGVACNKGSLLPACAAPQRPRRRVLQPVSALGPLDTVGAANVISQVVTTAAVAVGAWYLLGRENAYLEQDKLDQSKSSQPCPRCDGAGYEPCLCSRWSDGDAGCRTCRGTGYMPCRACRGGGTAIPLLASVRKQWSLKRGGSLCHYSRQFPRQRSVQFARFQQTDLW